MRISFALASLLLASACGGTASETPWPQEPEDVNLGPAGEEAERARGDAATPARKPEAPPEPAPSPRSDPVAP